MRERLLWAGAALLLATFAGAAFFAVLVLGFAEGAFLADAVGDFFTGFLAAMECCLEWSDARVGRGICMKHKKTQAIAWFFPLSAKH